MSNPLCDDCGMNLNRLMPRFPFPDLDILDFVFSPGSPRVKKSANFCPPVDGFLLVFPGIAFYSNLMKVQPPIIHGKAVDFSAQAGDGASFWMNLKRLCVVMSKPVDPCMGMMVNI